MTAETNAPKSDPQLNERNENSEAEQKLSYRGSVAGLKGLLSNKLAEGVASVVSSIDRWKDDSEEAITGTVALPIESIFPCPEQPRQVFDPRALEELSQTMRELGQAQAITVRKSQRGFEIISGERRYRAAKLAGLKLLDCVVKDCSPSEARLFALVENVQRQDLLPIEEAQFLRKVLDENPEWSLDQLAKKLGTHKSTLSEKIQLTEVPQDLQGMLYSKGRQFTHRHWRVLSRIQDPSLLRTMLSRAMDHHLSVAELERSVSALGIKKAVRRKRKVKQSRQTSFENIDLVRREGSSVRIQALTFEPSTLSGGAKQRLIEELETLLKELRPEGPSVMPLSPQD